jgi:hypothetical protein
MATIAMEIAIPTKASAIKHVCMGKTLLARFFSFAPGFLSRFTSESSARCGKT